MGFTWMFLIMLYFDLEPMVLVNGYRLRLYVFTPQHNCLSDTAIFDFQSTVRESVTRNTVGESNTVTSVVVPLTGGCTLTPALVTEMLNTLTLARREAAKDASTLDHYTAIVGPMLAPQCIQMEAWILSTPISCDAARSIFVYHVSYQCPMREHSRLFTSTDSSPPTCTSSTQQPIMEFNSFGSLSIGLSGKQLTEVLCTTLRNYKWHHLLVIYQSDPGTMLDGVAREVVVTLSRMSNPTITVVGLKAWDSSADLESIVYGNTTAYSACFMLAQLVTVSSFVQAVHKAYPKWPGQIPLIAFDYSLFAYDVTRVWRNLFANQPGLKSLQNTVLLLIPHPHQTELPLEGATEQEKTYLAMDLVISFAIQTARRKSMASVVNTNVSLFASLDGATLRVPITSTMTLPITFGKSGKPVDTALTFSLVLANPGPGRSTASFTRMAEISWPDQKFSNFTTSRWRADRAIVPNQPECATNNGIVMALIFMSVLTAVVVFALVAFFLSRWYRRRKMYREGPNKLILYPDDLTFVRLARSHRTTAPSNQDLRFPTLNSDQKLNAFSASRRTLQPDDPNKSLASVISGDGVSDTNTAKYNNGLVYVKRLLLENAALKSKFLDTVRTLREIRNENVNQMIGCYVDISSLCIVYDHCSRGSLMDIINKESIALDWEFKLSLITDVVKGMRYLHTSPAKKHGWLKSTNCCVDGRWVVKITDYGLPDIYAIYGESRKVDDKELLWTAPEHLRESPLAYAGSQKGDVYSFAILMQELITRSGPYGMLGLTATEILVKLRRPPPLCRPKVSQSEAPPAYIEFMKRAWAENPVMRPTFEEINQQLRTINQGRKINIVDHMFKIMEKYSADLEDQVRERTDELETEKKKTELLIARMLPPIVAENLMSGKPVEPEAFDDATIYFSDIVGFTTISAMSTPLQVVDLLNDLYTMFDSTIDYYDVYKVETIGDAYMVASGLPNRNGRLHAGETATMALDLLSQCGTFIIRHMPDMPLRLRIGLHSGSCVAGVVGLTMPRYCLFGDTVNTASRMESTGAAFRIHVSPTTKDILDELGGYRLELRGKVELKGKGIVDSFWLVGKDGFTKPLPVPPEINDLASLINPGDSRNQSPPETHHKENTAGLSSQHQVSHPSLKSKPPPSPQSPSQDDDSHSRASMGTRM